MEYHKNMSEIWNPCLLILHVVIQKTNNKKSEAKIK